MLIIPLSHDRMIVKELPFATIAIIAVCVISYYPMTTAIEASERAIAEARDEVVAAYEAHPYLALPDGHVASLPPPMQEEYALRAEWRRTFDESPEEARRFVKDWEKRRKTGTAGSLVDLVAAVKAVQGEPTASLEGLGLGSAGDDAHKAAFFSLLLETGGETMAAEQADLDGRLATVAEAEGASLLRKLAFVPSHPTLLGLVAHIFVHAGVLHLLFNMVFLWVAAAKLEDLWGRPVFLCAFLLFGAGAALLYAAFHVSSDLPAIGASGAVAGLMGATLVRLTRANIRFFYMYWLVSVKPRVGTFDAPAWLMIPLWLVGEIANSVLSSSTEVGYVAHLGGFAVGAAFAAVLKVTRFEERVLGREPEVEVRPEEAPLVAFRSGSGARTGETAAAAAPPSPAPRSGDKPIRFTVQELVVTGLDDRGISGVLPGGRALRIETAALAHVFAGRIARIDPRKDARFFGPGTLPGQPALLMALVKQLAEGPHADLCSVYLLDGAKIPYGSLVRSPSQSPEENLVALARSIRGLAPQVAALGPESDGGADELPAFAEIGALVTRIERLFR